MRYIYKIFLTILYKRKGKRDCISYNGNKNIIREFLSGSESYLVAFVELLVTDYNVNSKYNILKTSNDLEKITGKFNERTNEIQKIFQHEDEQILSLKGVSFHWVIILFLFLMDGLITRSILDVLFYNLGGYEIIIILVGFFVVVLAISINKIGEFFKTKNVLRWPISALILIVFLILTFIRVYGLKAFQDDLNPQSYQATFDDILSGSLFFTIYLLTAFVGGYFGYKDTHENPTIMKPLEKEYWERRKIVNTIKLKREEYEIKSRTYDEGWRRGEYLLRTKKASKRTP